MSLLIGGVNPFSGRSSHPFNVFEGELFNTLEELFSATHLSDSCGHYRYPGQVSISVKGKDNQKEGKKEDNKSDEDKKEKGDSSKQKEPSAPQYLRFGPYVIRTRCPGTPDYALEKPNICSEVPERGSDEGPWEVSLTLAGCDPNRISVEVKDGLLTVEGRKETSGSFTFVRHEQIIPRDVSPSSLRATFQSDGTLKIHQEENYVIPVAIEGASKDSKEVP